MYVITGATGNTGKPIAEGLLSEGKQVRVIGRSADRLKDLADKGADVFVGHLADSAAMKQAFDGASVAYLMIPPNMGTDDMRGYQNTVADSFQAALKGSSVKHVVTLSSVGADLDGGNGPVAGLHDMEKKLNELDGVHILHLRPGYFLENTLGQAGMVKAMGMMGGPVDPDVKFGMIATRDIAAYGLKRLLALDFTGHSTQDLQGQRDLSYSDVARVYGEAIGKPDLSYVRVSDEQFAEAMVGFGASEHVAWVMVELAEGLNEGRMKPVEARDSENTTPTSIEEFAQVFKMVYDQS